MWIVLMSLVITFILLRIAYFFLNHETVFPVGKRIASVILRDGVLHYTSKEIAMQILRAQEMVGSPDIKSTFAKRRTRKIVWLLLSSNSFCCRYCRRLIVKRHCPISPTGHDRSVKYEVKLLIKDIRPEYVSKMYFNLECAIGCYADCLKDATIVLAPLDNIDRALGIMPLNE